MFAFGPFARRARRPLAEAPRDRDRAGRGRHDVRGLGALVVAQSIAIVHLAIGSFVVGVCFAFIGPARQALVGELVPPERRGNATALALIANNASRIGGPAVAGVLLAWDAAGASAAYFAMGALYALAAATLRWLPPSRGRADRAITRARATSRTDCATCAASRSCACCSCSSSRSSWSASRTWR